MEYRRAHIVHSHTGGQKGYNPGSVCFSTGEVEPLREFRRNLPAESATINTCIDVAVVLSGALEGRGTEGRLDGWEEWFKK